MARACVGWYCATCACTQWAAQAAFQCASHYTQLQCAQTPTQSSSRWALWWSGPVRRCMPTRCEHTRVVCCEQEGQCGPQLSASQSASQRCLNRRLACCHSKPLPPSQLPLRPQRLLLMMSSTQHPNPGALATCAGTCTPTPSSSSSCRRRTCSRGAGTPTGLRRETSRQALTTALPPPSWLLFG